MNRKQGLFLSMLASVIAMPAAAQDAEPGFSDIKYLLNWRVRYETVDQDGIGEDASAFTSRVRAGIETGPFGDNKLLIEAVSVTDLIDDYNSTTNGKTGYPVVADPTGFTELNRLALVNTSIEDTTLTLGRQRLILDDARFVGNVGWRQNEQTFDGISSKTSGDNYTLDLAWITGVNRIFGPDHPQGDWDGEVVLINASRSFGFGKITAFAYGMDFDAPAAGNSNDTIGLRFNGSKPAGSSTISYLVSFASQSEAGANPVDYSENYTKLEGGISQGAVGFALGMEVLSGNGSKAFATPLATLHAFQGWADKFLGTPGAGLEDTYLKFTWKMPSAAGLDSLALTSFYHQFDADFGSGSYGDELDVSLVAKNDKFTATLKLALFSADSASSLTDTDKLWLSMDYAF